MNSQRNVNSDDTRVVSLMFDNSKFESNVKTSLSTLDRLKNALNFSKVKTGLSDVSSDIKKVDVKPLSDGIGVLSTKMSSLDVITKRWIENFTDKAYNNISNFVKSVTLEQKSVGWDKYADKTSAVQTIMSATSQDFKDQGKQMEYVNEQLEKLNWFTDETSYNFTDMTSNIGKFTSAGVKLNTAVTAMQGIANWAGISGANMQQASHAMYNLSQAMGTGSVKLMDWKSIENANMATQEFKQAAIDAAVELGTLKKVGDETTDSILNLDKASETNNKKKKNQNDDIIVSNKEIILEEEEQIENTKELTKVLGDAYTTLNGNVVSATNFNEALSDGWLTSEVLLKTLDRYGGFTTALYNAMEKIDYATTTSRMLEWIEQFKDGGLKVEKQAQKIGVSADELRGILEELSKDEYDFGRKAFAASQEAKTFGEAIDSVKDAVSTGWMNTFELIFGDYVHAKKLWTELANDLYDIFAAPGTQRNESLEKIFSQKALVNAEEYGILIKKNLIPATKEFKQELIDLGKKHGTITDDMTVEADNFARSLKDGWLSLDMINVAIGALSEEDAFGTLNANLKELQELIDKFLKGEITKGEFSNEIKDLGEYTEEQVSTYTDLLEAMKNGNFAYINSQEESIAAVNEAILGIGKQTEEQDKLNESLEKGAIKAKDFGEKLYKYDPEKGKGKWISNNFTTGEIFSQALMDSFRAMAELIAKIKNTWNSVFTGNKSTDPIRSFVVSFSNAVNKFRNFIENNEKFNKTLETIFSSLGHVANFVGKFFTSAFKSLGKAIDFVDEHFGWLIDAIKKSIGDITTFIEKNDIIAKTFDKIGKVVGTVVDNVLAFFGSFTNTKQVSKDVGNLGNIFISGLKTIGKIFDAITKGFEDFKNNIKNIDISNIFDSFDILKKSIWNRLSKIKIVKRITKTVNKIKDTIVQALSNIGIDVTNIWEKINKIFNIDNIRNGLGEFITGLINKFREFGDSVKKLGGFSFSNIGEVLKNFKDTVGKYLFNIENYKGIGKWIADTFLNIINSIIKTVKKVVSKFLKSIGINVNKIGKKFKKIFKINGAVEKFGEFISGLINKFKEFISRVKELGGLSFSNVGGVLKSFKDTVIKYLFDINSYKGIGKWIADTFLNIVKSISDKLKDIGVNIDAAVNKVKSLKDSSPAIAMIVKFFTLLKEKVIAFKDAVVDLGGIKFSNILNVFKAFKENVIDSIFNKNTIPNIAAWIGVIIGEIIKRLPALFHLLVTAILVMIDNIIKTVTGIDVDFAGFFEWILSGFVKLKTSLKKIGDWFKTHNPITALVNLIDTLMNASSEERARMFLNAINIIRDAIHTIVGVVILIGTGKTISKIVDIIDDVSDAIAALKKAESLSIKGTALLKFATAIGIITGCVYALSQIKYENSSFAQVISTIGGVAGALVGASIAIDKIVKDAEKVETLYNGILKVSEAVGILTAAMFVLSRLSPESLSHSVISLIKMLGSVAAFILAIGLIDKLLNRLNGGGLTDGEGDGEGDGEDEGGGGNTLLDRISNVMKSIAAFVLSVAASVAILGVAMMIFKHAVTKDTSPGAIALFIVSIIMIVGSVIGLVVLLSKMPITQVTGMASTIISFAGSILILALALGMLSAITHMGVANAFIGLGLLAGLMVELGLFISAMMFVFTKWNPALTTATAINVLAFVGAIIGLGVAMAGLSILNKFGLLEDAYLPLTIIAGILAGLMAVSHLLSASWLSITMIAAVVVAVGGVIGALVWLASITDDFDKKMDKISSSFMVMLFAVAGLMFVSQFMTACVFSILSIVGVIAAIGVLMGAMSYIVSETKVDPVEIGLAILEIAGAIAGIMGVCILLGGFAPFAVAGAIILIAFLAAMVVLIGVVVGIFALISLLIGSFASDELGEKVTKGIDGMIKFAEKVGEFLTSIFSGMGAGVFSGLPKIAEFINTFIDTMKDIKIEDVTSACKTCSTVGGEIAKISLKGFFLSLDDFVSDVLTGKTTAENFRDSTGTLSKALTEWAKSMNDIGEIKVPKKEIEALQEAIKNMPMDGFIFKNVPDTTDLKKFTTDLLILGESVKLFNEKIKDDEFDSGNLVRVANALKAFAEFGVLLNQVAFSSEGIFGKTEGSFEKFAKEIGGLGDAVNSIKEIKIEEDKLENITETTQKLRQMIDDLAKLSISKITIINNDTISKLDKGITDFALTINKVDIVDQERITRLKETVATLSEIKFEGDLSSKEKTDQFVENVKKISDEILRINGVTPATSSGGLLNSLTSLFGGGENGISLGGEDGLLGMFTGFFEDGKGKIKDKVDEYVEGLSEENGFVGALINELYGNLTGSVEDAKEEASEEAEKSDDGGDSLLDQLLDFIGLSDINADDVKESVTNAAKEAGIDGNSLESLIFDTIGIDKEQVEKYCKDGKIDLQGLLSDQLGMDTDLDSMLEPYLNEDGQIDYNSLISQYTGLDTENLMQGYMDDIYGYNDSLLTLDGTVNSLNPYGLNLYSEGLEDFGIAMNGLGPENIIDFNRSYNQLNNSIDLTPDDKIVSITKHFKKLLNVFAREDFPEILSNIDLLGKEFYELSSTDKGIQNLQKPLDAVNKTLGMINADDVSKIVDLSNAVNLLNKAMNTDEPLQPVITPVLDLSQIESGTQTITNMFNRESLTPDLEGLVQAQIDLTPVETAINDLKVSNENGTISVLEYLTAVSNHVDNLADAINTIQLRLDTGVLVGEITPKINRQLGNISRYA